MGCDGHKSSKPGLIREHIGCTDLVTELVLTCESPEEGVEVDVAALKARSVVFLPEDTELHDSVREERAKAGRSRRVALDQVVNVAHIAFPDRQLRRQNVAGPVASLAFQGLRVDALVER